MNHTVDGANLWSFLRQLSEVAHQVSPGWRHKRMIARYKIMLMGLCQYRLTRSWFQVVRSALPECVRVRHPRLWIKLQRPHLRHDLRPEEILRHLSQHYRFLRTHFTPLQRDQIYSESGLVILKLSLKEMGEWDLRLQYLTCFEREAELVLSLYESSSGERLVSLAFEMTYFEDQRREIWIAGLQSTAAEQRKEQIVSLTRSMHGLRPKALLLFVLQEWAARWNINSLRAVGNDVHIWQHWARKKKVSLDYDEFWVESGGVKDAEGFYQLPLRHQPRAVSEIKPNKRSLYRKRYQWLEELSRAWTEDAFGKSAPHHSVAGTELRFSERFDDRPTTIADQNRRPA